MRNGVSIKTKEDIKILRECGRRLARVLEVTGKEVKPGVTTKYLNDFAHKMIVQMGDRPSFLNYKPFGADYPYPGSICISVNDEVVHGIGSNRVLKEGDIVGLDGGVTHKGLITDGAITIPVGKIHEKDKELILVTKKALMAGIKACVSGNYVNDISRAIEKSVPRKFGIVKVLCGHGVGYKPHEDPQIPNFDDGIRGPRLVSGMVLALEPMINLGTDEVYLENDGYTFVTKDHKKSAHFEHTVLITNSKPEILTT